jgi:hypothetical protein
MARVCRQGGDAGEGIKEWSRGPEKWSGRSSLAAQNSLWGRGTTGGGCRWWSARGGRRRQGNSHCPASLAGAACRFSTHEGHGNGALLLVQSDNSEAACRCLATVGEAAVGAEQSNEMRRSNSGRGSKMGGGLLW